MLPFFERKDTDFFVYEYKNFSFSPHLHPSLEIVWARRGEIKLVIEEEGHILHEGEMGIVFPGQIHSYEYQGEGEGSIFIMSPALCGTWWSSIDDSEPVCPIVNSCNLSTDATLALERLRSLQNEDLKKQKTYARLFLCCLLEKLPLKPAEEKHDLLHLVVDYMEKHFKERLTLDKVASDLYISRFTVSRLFNASLHQNFNDYLNSLRIAHSVELIEQGYSISAAAYDSGFDNLRTFNRAFKKLMNKTPSSIR